MPWMKGGYIRCIIGQQDVNSKIPYSDLVPHRQKPRGVKQKGDGD